MASRDGFQICAVTEDNEVYCWGDNEFGGLGFYDFGEGNYELPVKLTNVTDVKNLTVGGGWICARKHNGLLPCWGWLDEGLGGRRGEEFEDYYGRVFPTPIVWGAEAE